MPPLLIHTARDAAFWRRLWATCHGKNTKLLWLRVCRHMEQVWLKLTNQKKFVADERMKHFLVWNNLVPSIYEKTHQYYKNRFSGLYFFFFLRIKYLCFQFVLQIGLWQAGHVWLGKLIFWVWIFGLVWFFYLPVLSWGFFCTFQTHILASGFLLWSYVISNQTSVMHQAVSLSVLGHVFTIKAHFLCFFITVELSAGAGT